jgi:poly(A) polymerase
MNHTAMALSFPSEPVAQQAKEICLKLQDAGYRALLAGGCVRDMILGKRPGDYDIVTSATPQEILPLFARTRPVGVQFGVILVIVEGVPYEVATFRQDGAYVDGRHPQSVSFSNEEEDARRRDFTINALFYDPRIGELLDYVNGLEDLDNQIVRAVGEPRLRFQEDRLRLLRAIRFSARLGYAIEEETLAALQAEKEGICDISVERVRDELIRIFTGANAHQALHLLEETGLLEILLPEVYALRGVEQPPQFHPEGDVLTHTALALSCLPPEPSPSLALGLLFHDLGKKETASEKDGRICFHGHAKKGADMAWEICQRLRMPKKLTARIVWLVENHMKIHLFPDMRLNKKKQLVREEGFEELLELARCDCLASHGDLAAVEATETWCAVQQQEELSPQLFLTGDDLIALGYKPGRHFREKLEKMEEAQLDGIVANKEEAVVYLKKHFPLSQE